MEHVQPCVELMSAFTSTKPERAIAAK